jgi:hypothetical protein
VIIALPKALEGSTEVVVSINSEELSLVNVNEFVGTYISRI